MSRPIDATLKSLLEMAPADWPVLAGYPRAAVDVIDADVSTVSGAADKVLRVHGPPDWILHLEFQAGPDATLPRRTHGYNALLEERHDLLVQSVVLLLRPQADLSVMTGVYERQFPGQPPYLTFRYRVIRVWELPTAALLGGGIATLPLAPISAVRREELPGVIERMAERLRRHRPRGQAAALWTATYVLLGLHYEPSFVNHLLQGVMEMEESTTYQYLIAKGEHQGALREARKTLLVQGRDRFGPPPEETIAAIEGMDDLERLEQLHVRVLHVSSWDELLQAPQAPPPARGRPTRTTRRGRRTS